MKKCSYGYYGFDCRGRTFIYVPHNLIGITGICSEGEFTFDYRPDTLSMISSLFSKRLINRDDLLKKGWDICRVEIPDYFLRGFCDLCFKLGDERKPDERLSSIIHSKATEIADYASDLASFDSSFSSEVPDVSRRDNPPRSSGQREIIHDGGYHEIIPEDEEDIKDDWWTRGEDPFL